MRALAALRIVASSLSNRLGLTLVATACAIGLTSMRAGGSGLPQWEIVKPSTTGIPGEELRVMAFDPQGNLWVAARWPFWGECGLAMLPASELPHTPLPGGGFDTGKWHVWSNVHHPIPSPLLTDMEIAADGTIWISSEGGLTRFRPNATTPQDMWLTYNTSNSPLIMNSVRSLDQDSQGNIWLTNVSVQSSNGAVFRFNPSSNPPTWTKYSVGQELPSGWAPPWYNVNAVYVSPDDHVWVTHISLWGMAEFDGNSWVLHDGQTGALGGMMADLQGNIWITSASAGLWKFNGTGYENFDIGGDGTVTALGMDPTTGLVYAGNWYGDIFKMVAVGNSHTPQYFFNAGAIPGSINVLPNGDIWLRNGGGNGVVGTVRHHSTTGQLLERFNTYNTGMPWYFIDRIQTDIAGNLWFASGEAGISRFDGERWRNWGNHNDGAEPYPWAGNEPMGGFFIDRDGMGWMGGNGIGRWNPDTGEFTGFWNVANNPGMGVTTFTVFAQDGQGKLFAGTEGGRVYSFNGTLWVEEPLPEDSYTSTFAWLKSDSAGNVYAAKPLHLHKWNGTSWMEVSQPAPDYWFDLGGINCMTIGPPPQEYMWIGTDEGLVRWDGETYTVFNTANSPLPAMEVQAVDVRADGLVGLSAYEFGAVTPFPNGVALIDGDPALAANWSVYQYGQDPLTHYQLGNVKFDAQGRLWISCISEGMVVLTPPTPVILGDITGDGVVNANDLLALINAWGACPQSGTCPADIAPSPNGDGTVGVPDLLMIINNWG